MENVRSNIFFGKQFVAVEHCHTENGDILNVLVVGKNNNELTVKESFQVGSIDALIEKLDKHQHLFLIINNDKVITREIEGEFDSQKSIISVFPTIKMDEFYFEVLPLAHSAIINLCRKSEVATILDDYTKIGLAVIGFSLGCSSVQLLESIYHEPELYTSNTKLLINDGKFSKTESYNGNELKQLINGLEIDNHFVLPLSGILSYCNKPVITISNFSQIIQQLRSNFKQQRTFTLGLKISLATVFTLLLFSFLAFTHYSSKVTELSQTLELNKSQKDLLLKLSDEMAQKELLIKNYSTNTSKASWYLDKLAITIPHGILLTNMEWQPVKGTIKENEVIEIEYNKFVLEGHMNNGNVFSEWIIELEKQSWIEHVMIDSYGTSKNNLLAFVLTIKVKE
jgi:hypothetical protein